MSNAASSALSIALRSNRLNGLWSPLTGAASHWRQELPLPTLPPFIHTTGPLLPPWWPFGGLCHLLSASHPRYMPSAEQRFPWWPSLNCGPSTFGLFLLRPRYASPYATVKNCHDRRSCKILACWINFCRKQRGFLQILSKNTNLTQTKCDFILILLKF